jgi:hypothetical protein
MPTPSDWVTGLPGPLVRLWIWLRSWIYPPSARFDSALIDAIEWAEGYAPSGQEDVYALVATFSEKQHNLMLSLSDGLDKKADEHLRFMTTVVGAITAAAAGKLVRFEHPWLAFLSLFPILLALVAALRARAAQVVETPTSPRALLGVADLEPRPARHQVESTIAASYHVAIFGMKSLTTWKARLLNRSTLAFLIGFALLLLSIIPRW